MDFAKRYGPWAVIAGASDGTGREFARKVARAGVSCILFSRRESVLKELADEIRAESGVECVTASVDLAAPDATAKILAAVGDREVGLYISNAGADSNASHFLDKPLDPWLDMTRRNVMTVMECCHHFGGPMRARGRGGLLLVNSLACYNGASYVAVYSATKAFELCFTEGLWAELRGSGVDVLGLVLSGTDTPVFRDLSVQQGAPMPPHLASPAEVAEVGLAQLPHGPLYNWGQSNDVAGHAPTSPDDRRARIIGMDEVTKFLFTKA